jgi:hypothetical protein
VVQAVQEPASMRRSTALLLLAGASARADVQVQNDVALFSMEWRPPPPLIEPRLSTTTMTADQREVMSLGFRFTTGVQVDSWRVAMDFDESPHSLMAWRTLGAYAPHLGPLQLQLGVVAGVGGSMEPGAPGLVAYLDGDVGLRYRIGYLAVGASFERSIVATQTNWIGALSIGFDIPVTPVHRAPKNQPLRESDRRASLSEDTWGIMTAR